MSDPLRDAAPAGLMASLAPWLRLLARRRRRLLLGALLMALTLFSAIGLLALSGWFITASALTGWLLAAGVAARLDVYVPGGGIRFFAVTRTVSRYFERVYNHDSVLRLLADLRARLFGALAGLDDRALARRRASDWLDRLTADIDLLDGLYLRLLAPPAVAALAVLGLAGLLAWWLPAAGLAVLLVLVPAGLWLTLGQAWRGMRASHRQVNELSRLRAGLIERLQGLAELEAYGSLETYRHRLDELEARIQRDQRRLGRQAALGNALVGAALGTTLVAVLWLAAQARAAGGLSGPLMVMMPLAVLALAEGLAVLPAAFTRLGASRAAAERLSALRRASEAAEARAPSGPPQPGALAVRLEGVTLRYPGALTPALAELSLSLAPGERLALCGESGSGKSSVAALLAGRLAADEGRVLLGGVEAMAWPARQRAARVALLTQRVDLFDDSLAANLRLADPEADEPRLWRALEAVALDDWARELPRGLATRVGEGGRRLSGGQARRLALARLLLRDPDLVLLDEPFAGLDAGTAARVAAALDGCLAGRTVIYLVHGLDGGPFDPPGVTRALRLAAGHLVD